MFKVEGPPKLRYDRAVFVLEDKHKFVVWMRYACDCNTISETHVGVKIYGTDTTLFDRVSALFPGSVCAPLYPNDEKSVTYVAIRAGIDDFVDVAEKIAAEFGVQC